LDVEPELIEGANGEWRVLVDGQVVAKKGMLLFPSDAKVLRAVADALALGRQAT
jgi:hypothetical protein